MRPRRSDLKYPKLSYEIIGSAMDVHSELGPGQIEPFYHLALRDSLERKGVEVRYKPSGKLVHRGIVADEFEADLIAEERIIPELKALEAGFAQKHFTQLICYLKFWKKDLGFLLDFGKECLAHKRVPYTERQGEVEVESAKDGLSRLAPRDRELGAAIVQAAVSLQDLYGIGYRDTTYIGLVRAELTAEGIPFVEDPLTQLSFKGRDLGAGKCNCLLVDNRFVVKVYALYDSIHAAHRATVQAYLKHLDVPAGLLVNFGKRTLEVRCVKVGSK